MAGILPGDPSHHGMVENSPYNFSHDKHEEADCTGSAWYLSRREIEENSPSRRDGIDLKKEAYFRKSYCTFLQDLGMRLKVPQVTIATAIVFCHRFFLRQSHVKNDRRTIATVCMFLAGKVEETPRPLKDVILVSYEIIHKKDPAAAQRIKQREVYEQQKELILLGERVVLATLGFDLNVHHPYKPLVEAIKKFKVAQNALAQVAWNFVNDGLRTSLCLQFKPHHIAAGAIFLAAKFLKVKLPSDGEVVWWQEFDVTPRQLEVVSNQMLELYEQNRATPPSHGTETEGSSAGGMNHRAPPVKAPAAVDETPAQNKYVPVAGTTSSATRPEAHGEKQNGTQRVIQMDGGCRHHEQAGNVPEASSSRQNNEPERPFEQPRVSEVGGAAESQEKNYSQKEPPKGYSQSPTMDAMKKIDKDKVKAALEKRRKSRGEVTRKMDFMDEDDLIERELESGIELAAEDERMKQERRHSWSKLPPPYSHGVAENGNSEEGELSLEALDSGSRKRRALSPASKPYGVKEGFEAPQHYAPSKHRDGLDRSERDNKRIRQENPV